MCNNNSMKNIKTLHITQQFPTKELFIGFVKTKVGDKWANDYYYMVKGEAPQGPYADEEDAHRGWFFNECDNVKSEHWQFQWPNQ